MPADLKHGTIPYIVKKKGDATESGKNKKVRLSEHRMKVYECV